MYIYNVNCVYVHHLFFLHTKLITSLSTLILLELLAYSRTFAALVSQWTKVHSFKKNELVLFIYTVYMRCEEDNSLPFKSPCLPLQSGAPVGTQAIWLHSSIAGDLGQLAETPKPDIK